MTYNKTLKILGKNRTVSIKKYKLNNILNVSSVLLLKNYWIHFTVTDEINIEQTIIDSFENMIKCNRKNRKKNIVYSDYLVFEELDGQLMLGIQVN